VNVNDVEVMIDAKTTPDQAMAQFHQKYNKSICVAHKSSNKHRVSKHNTRA